MTAHNVNTIAITQDKILTQDEASYTSVCPSAMSTSITSTTNVNSAVEQQMNTLTKMMQILIQQQTAPSTNPAHAKSQKAHSGVITKWQQWTYWWYMGGTNLSRNSDKCKRPTKYSNHDQLREATKENPQGGNDSRDHLWMKWYHQVTHNVHETKGEWNMWGNDGRDVTQNKSNIHVNTIHHCPYRPVTFADPLPVYKGHGFSISLRLCNQFIDRYPKEDILRAVNSAATDHFMPASDTGWIPNRPCGVWL